MDMYMVSQTQYLLTFPSVRYVCYLSKSASHECLQTTTSFGIYFLILSIYKYLSVKFNI